MLNSKHRMTELDNSSSSEASVEAKNSKVSMESDIPTFAKTRIQEELVLGLIRQAEALGTTSIDLCHKGLKTIPDDLLQLTNLEHLYLEGNELTSLPENLFDVLTNLQWLDLRGNKLNSLPAVISENPPKLRNLLLEGNNLTTLPPELGLIKSLNGLNINNNPLNFPPIEIIEKGTQEILHYLREVLRVKSKTAEVEALVFEDSPDDQSGSADADEEDWENYNELIRRKSTMSASSRTSSSSDPSALTGPVHQQLELHQPTSYSEIRAQHLDKLKKTGADGRQLARKKSSSKSKTVQKYPAPPSDAYVSFKMAEERKTAKEKELKMRQEAILQRRRDEESLKNWRDESKKKQQKKYLESLRNGGLDFDEPVKHAPFGIDEGKLRMISKEEKIKEDVKATHEKLRRRPLTPGERLKLEEEKAMRIRELERRIKAHTLQMVDRRRRPKGTPHEEMLLAQKELEVAEGLQRELSRNRKQLEYRFRAFTGDVIEHHPPASTKIRH